jgi:UDP-N-acetylglucosamine 1-carboxyvinyltransferase
MDPYPQARHSRASSTPSMSVLRVTGGTPLRGTVGVSGSKNAALPMMAASILAEEPVRLQGVPRLADVETLSLVLRDLGMEVARTAGDQLVLQTVDPTPIRARYNLVRRMRASFCVLGPLLARRGRAAVSLPGGCNIGDRPVDLHLRGLSALGASLRMRHGYVLAQARRLRGTTIDLSGPRGPTVTGTANVLSAAVLAEGETTITGAAREPEVVDLGRFLVALGAEIHGLGTPTLRIVGVDRLGGGTYRVIPDRIEAATLLLAAAITGGSATVTGVIPGHLNGVLEALRAAGSQIEVGSDRVSLTAGGRPRPIDVTARPYPGIPTDVQAQLTALVSLAPGRSTVGDAVFGNRFLHVAELSRLGARIRCCQSTAVVTGVERLTGTPVTASDLRASAALVLAGLAAEGETIVRRAHHLDRGYQRLHRKLNRLGAQIERGQGRPG